MEINVSEIKSFKSYKAGGLVKTASVDVIVKILEENFQLKFYHESIGHSDFLHHKDISLVHNNFIFFYKNKCGTWYNFPDISKLFEFIGKKIDTSSFLDIVTNVKNNSLITEYDI